MATKTDALTWKPGPPPLNSNGLWLMVFPDGRNGKATAPLLVRLCDWMNQRPDVLWHIGPVPEVPIPSPPNGEKE
jgi:hypothetical protein